MDDPELQAEAPELPANLSQKLTYYRGHNLGALAPRGWHCFELYGSAGSHLIITPENHDGKDLFDGHSGLVGPAIQLSQALGGTSGRFDVARTCARLFPAMRGFVEGVINEGIWPASDFPSGPYPGDHLRRRGDTEIQFETPANLDGMGTQSRLVKNGRPIRGIAKIENVGQPELYLLLLDVRLPADMDWLAPTLLHFVP